MDKYAHLTPVEIALRARQLGWVFDNYRQVWSIVVPCVRINARTAKAALDITVELHNQPEEEPGT